jgi:hypothetical protein
MADVVAGLPPDERARASRDAPWALADWLHWMEPSERQWYWWDNIVDDADQFRILLVISGSPAPLGALGWLIRVAGGQEITADGGA